MSKPLTITLTDNTLLALSLSPRLRRQAGIKLGDQLEVRVSSGIVTLIPKPPAADDEYTPEQRRAIDAQLDEAEDGAFHGPFDSAGEMVAHMKGELKKRTAPKPKRPRSR